MATLAKSTVKVQSTPWAAQYGRLRHPLQCSAPQELQRALNNQARESNA
jgi:hypothetical protein